MLTIGQLADYVGVTVRAVRHYHQRGLLPEPERDASGYRRYDADAVISLIRIKALADAGVPLARIRELLAAGPAEFAGAVAEIDKAMAGRIRALQAQRHRVAQLVAGNRLSCPRRSPTSSTGYAASASARSRCRSSGTPGSCWPRDSPDRRGSGRGTSSPPSPTRSSRPSTVPTTRHPAATADPRLDEIAESIVNFAERHRADLEDNRPALPPDDPVAMALVLSRTAGVPPSWERLDQPSRQGTCPGPERADHRHRRPGSHLWTSARPGAPMRESVRLRGHCT